MMSGNNIYDVILLFGPPIQNKSSFLPSSYFRKDFTVLSPEEIFKENPSLGLRDVTLNVVTELKKGKQVFIEDEFRLKGTRSSILKTLKKKVPHCSILLVKILPKYGVQQVCWSHQYCFVQHKKMLGNFDYRQIKLWFDDSQLTVDLESDYVDHPDEKEGFDIRDICSPLRVASKLKFEIPCLFIQWETVVSTSGDILPSMQDVFIKWKSNNPDGRIIFIYDGKNVAKGYVSEYDENMSIKRYLNDLAVKIAYPVYVLSVKAVSRTCSFCLPPLPGMLAFLQLQHSINLHSKQTVYIYDSAEHMNMAQAAGVRHVKGKKLQMHPDFTFQKQAFSPPIPAMLKNVVYEEDETLCAQFSLPLYDQRDKMAHGCVSQSYDNGLHLSVFVPSVQIFKGAQESLTESLLRTQICPTDAPNPEETHHHVANETSDLDVNQDLPVWMGKKLRRSSTIDSVSSLENQSGSDPNSSLRCSTTVYIMTEKELQELAFQVLAQAGKDTNKMSSGPSTSALTGPG